MSTPVNNQDKNSSGFPTKKAIRGALVGAVCGPIVVAVAAAIYGLASSLDVLSFVFVVVVYEGVSAAFVGAVIGAANGMTDGGIGAGLEWLVIAATAYLLGAWYLDNQLQAFNGMYTEDVILMGIVGGVVGFLTWLIFRIKNAKKQLSVALPLSYLGVFLLITVVGSCIGAYTVFFFSD